MWICCTTQTTVTYNTASAGPASGSDSSDHKINCDRCVAVWPVGSAAFCNTGPVSGGGCGTAVDSDTVSWKGWPVLTLRHCVAYGHKYMWPWCVEMAFCHLYQVKTSRHLIMSQNCGREQLRWLGWNTVLQAAVLCSADSIMIKTDYFCSIFHNSVYYATESKVCNLRKKMNIVIFSVLLLESVHVPFIPIILATIQNISMPF